jgi:tryptophan 2,3-dioxygenase
LRELTNWLSAGSDPGTFPYATVVAEFHRTGKHFVADDLLVLLDRIRTAAATPPAGATQLLRSFLDVALDKWDGRYDYQSYLALSLLRIPYEESTDDRRVDLRRQHDRLYVHLIADALDFELAAEARTTDLLPRQRPEPARLAKRYRLGIRAASPALARLGRPAAVDHPEPAATAAALHAVVVADQSAAERRDLRLGMLPVYLVHDEYLFIRVLQAYESTFALLAGELRATVGALTGGRPRAAADRLAYARDLLNGAAPLFSLMASMQPESFRAFRVYTEGASAIQSRSYKLVESLCRLPEEPRLSSAAYRSVPEVRDRVLAGQPSVEQAYHTASRVGRLGEPDRRLLDARMGEFASALIQWRHTHYRIATRMLGTRPGTGYTEGTPYLAAARSIPVFTTTNNAR